MTDDKRARMAGLAKAYGASDETIKGMLGPQSPEDEQAEQDSKNILTHALAVRNTFAYCTKCGAYSLALKASPCEFASNVGAVEIRGRKYPAK